MIVKKLSLPRRTFLRGMGATLALPFLDAMVPALSAMAKTAAKPACRLGFVYVPHGVLPEFWTPKTVGSGFELTPVLRPLGSLRDHVVVATNLNHRQADSFGDGNGDHPRAVAVWLSGVHAYDRRITSDIKLGITADQVAAQTLGKFTQLPSLEICLDNPSKIACDSGDCFYGNTLSWRTPTTPNPMESNPRVVFERLFGDGGTAKQRLSQIQKSASILDSVNEELAGLERTLGPRDRTRLDDYFEAVRSVEQRIQVAEAQGLNDELLLPDRPTGIPGTFEEHTRLIFDLQTLAFQCDMTRVITLMMAGEGSGRSYPEIGVPEQHHPLSHHRSRPKIKAKKAKIDQYHVKLLAYFLEKLRDTPDGDGSLLDHSMILYGSGLGDGNLHEHTNLPTLLAGGGCGTINGGRHLTYPAETPMANLLLTMLDKAGVPTPETIGDSTGHLYDI